MKKEIMRFKVEKKKKRKNWTVYGANASALNGEFV